jgi:uncharacterized repeat protein (TIGR03803 family)
MASKKRSPTWIAAIIATTLISATPAVTQAGLLHSFGQGTDGVQPWAAVTLDSSGNVFGTTYSGGTYKAGIVFELTPGAGGTWNETVIHEFGSSTDGHNPRATLMFDSAGNLYGTTNSGGHYHYGTVFQLTPASGGGWTETVVHEFNNTDGDGPHAGLIQDAAGNLYGTTYSGGAYGFGVAFELIPTGGGAWTEKILHSFGHGKDGAYCESGVIFDRAGNLYGTTTNGGLYNQGTVFELTPTGGRWIDKILHSFNANTTTDGYQPYAGVIFDAAGNLYGTSAAGGTYGYGTVYELMPQAGGLWTEKILHNFSGSSTGGAVPEGGLISDAMGNLYGTAVGGGPTGFGMVFELAPNAGGNWSMKVLHSFNGKDGYLPLAGAAMDAFGNLYATTSSGGAYKQGTVFQVQR